MHENFCMSSKIFNIMILVNQLILSFKSDKTRFWGRKSKSSFFNLQYKRDIRDWKSFKANVYFIFPALFSYIKIINGCKLRPLSCQQFQVFSIFKQRKSGNNSFLANITAFLVECPGLARIWLCCLHNLFIFPNALKLYITWLSMLCNV